MQYWNYRNRKLGAFRSDRGIVVRFSNFSCGRRWQIGRLTPWDQIRRQGNNACEDDGVLHLGDVRVKVDSKARTRTTVDDIALSTKISANTNFSLLTLPSLFIANSSRTIKTGVSIWPTKRV
jgi:hypothetical protein